MLMKNTVFKIQRLDRCGVDFLQCNIFSSAKLWFLKDYKPYWCDLQYTYYTGK